MNPSTSVDLYKRGLTRRVRVTAFIDWNSQIHNWNLINSTIDETRKACLILERTSRIISRALITVDPSARYVVNVRLYHGWTKGYQDMPAKLAVRNAVAGLDFSSLSRSASVVINPDIGYGDLLLDAREERIHRAKRIHLPGTVRQRDKAKRLEEKMVDTALASDLLASARSDPGDWAIILAEDDDLVPPIFTAELWKEDGNGRVFLMQKRVPAHRLVNLDGLLLQVAWNV